MRKLIFILSLLFVLPAFPAFSQNTTITVSKVYSDLSETPLSSFKFCLSPVNASGQATSVTLSGGGSIPAKTYCWSGTNGVVSGVTVPDTSTASPSGLGYSVSIMTGSNVPYYSYTQAIHPSGGTWSFDDWSPTEALNIAPPQIATGSDVPSACTAPSIFYTSSNEYICVGTSYTELSGSSGGMTALTGDVTASGSGSQAATVKGINGTILSSLGTGLLKITNGTGVPSIATPGTDYVTPSQLTFGSLSGVASPSQLPVATSSAAGAVKPDNSTITINNGVISSVGGSSAPVGLPAGYNVLYSFVADGDQSGTTLHDASGSGNNGTLGGSPLPTWTGTGLSFVNASSVSLPSSLNTDETFCASVYIPPALNSDTPVNPEYYTLIGNSQGLTGFSFLLGSGPIYVLQPTTFANSSFITEAKESEDGFHTYCVVQGLSSNSTDDRIFMDGVEVTYSQQGRTGNVQTAGNLDLGVIPGVSGGYFLGDYEYFVAWPGQLTVAQAESASYAITQAVANKGVQVVPSQHLTNIQYVYAAGDSITEGHGLPAGDDWLTLSTMPSAYTKVHNGVSGFLAQGIAGMARWRDTPYCYSGTGKSVAIIYAGVNDFLVYGNASGPSVYSSLLSWASIMQSAGCKVGIATMISGGAYSQGVLDTQKNALNPIIRAGAATGDYFVVDFASDPNMGADGAYANATYFQGDHLHPTAVGQQLLANAASNAVASSTGNSSADPTLEAANSYSMLSSDNCLTMTPTAAATVTLPDCIGVIGNVYSISNTAAGANTITVSGLTNEAITGAATIAQNDTGKVRATLTSQATGGCGWLRVN